MVNAIGLVTFIRKHIEPKKKVFQQADNILVELIEYNKVQDYTGTPFFEVTCKYNILLPENDECKSVDDYASHVFPFLEQHIGKVIITEIYNLSKINHISNMNHIKNIIKEHLNA